MAPGNEIKRNINVRKMEEGGKDEIENKIGKYSKRMTTK